MTLQASVSMLDAVLFLQVTEKHSKSLLCLKGYTTLPNPAPGSFPASLFQLLLDQVCLVNQNLESGKGSWKKEQAGDPQEL